METFLPICRYNQTAPACKMQQFNFTHPNFCSELCTFCFVWVLNIFPKQYVGNCFSFCSYLSTVTVSTLYRYLPLFLSTLKSTYVVSMLFSKRHLSTIKFYGTIIVGVKSFTETDLILFKTFRVSALSVVILLYLQSSANKKNFVLMPRLLGLLYLQTKMRISNERKPY